MSVDRSLPTALARYCWAARRLLLPSALWLVASPPCVLSQTLCQVVYGDQTVTLQFFQKSLEASNQLFGKVSLEHSEASNLVARGLLAEMKRQPEPQLLRGALVRLEAVSAAMSSLESALRDLIVINRQDKPIPLFEDALARLLRDSFREGRPQRQGRRYANVAGIAVTPAPAPKNLTEVLEFQRADLEMIHRQLEETIESLRSAIPDAESHQFAAAMFSGRAPFFSRFQQSIDLLEQYRRFYLDTCGCTTAATFQAYPVGLQWLEEAARTEHTEQ